MNVSFQTYTDAQIDQMKRSEELETLGFTDNAECIAKEWEGSSLLETQWLSIDCFVK